MIRRLIYGLLVGAFAWLVVSRFNEISRISSILAQGHIQWVLVALGLQTFYYFISSFSYKEAFLTVGVKSRLRDLIPLLFGAIFVNVAAPAGGASGAALFIDHAVRTGQSAVRTAAGLFLQLVMGMVAFVVLLAAGLLYLAAYNKLEGYDLVATLLLLIATGLIGGALYLAIQNPGLLRGGLDWMRNITGRLASKVHRQAPISEEWIEQHAGELGEAGEAISAHPSRVAWTMAALLLAHGVNIAVLYCLFMAFSLSIPLGSLVAGYAVGILFLIVSVTPQGIGVVEGIMPVVFGSLGIPYTTATITVLAFRGLSLWLPLAIGFIFLRSLKVFHGTDIS